MENAIVRITSSQLVNLIVALLNFTYSIERREHYCKVHHLLTCFRFVTYQTLVSITIGDFNKNVKNSPLYTVKKRDNL